MFREGFCLALPVLLVLFPPEPKIDPDPDPNRALGKLDCLVVLGRDCCGWRSGEALWKLQGDKAGVSSPGVRSSC